MSERLSIRWDPPGPVAARYYWDRSRVAAIMGPIGSGKTIATLMKLVQLAGEQRRSSVDGRRKFKACVVRDTYRQLWKTTIPSWWKRVPKTLGDWAGADGGPATHSVKFQLPDGSIVDFVIEFVAIGENKVEDVLRGYEPTAFYLNEADLLAEDVLIYANSRVGRYPDMSEGGPSWCGVLLDFNAPDTESWIYKRFVEELPEGWAFFRQPSGFDARAENIANLPAGYYEEAAKGQPDWWVRRMVKNEFGFTRDGQPVYPEYNDQLHCAPEDLKPIPGLRLKIGFDAGGTPAATIWQRALNGQWRGLDEIVATGGYTGANRFGDLVAQVLAERYRGYEAEGWGDPSAQHGHDREAGEASWLETVGNKVGFMIRPAPSNEILLRTEAVRVPLTRLIDGVHPGLIISPRMKMLRKGFNAGYRYRRRVVAGIATTDVLPEKNEYSHPHDSAQYALLGGGEVHEVMGRTQRRRMAAAPVIAQTEFNVFS